LGFAGSYDQAPAIHRAIKKRIEASGVRVAGPLREAYCRFGADLRGDRLPKRFLASTVADYRTELQVPVLDA